MKDIHKVRLIGTHAASTLEVDKAQKSDEER